MSQLTNISIVIVTYQRGHTLLNTLDSILCQDASVDDVIVVDQTPYHDEQVNQKLTVLHQQKKINWLREAKPSIPRSMNIGASQSNSEWLLYLDDDVLLAKNFLACWIQLKNDLIAQSKLKSLPDKQKNTFTAIIAARVIQPWHDGFKQKKLTCDILPLTKTDYFMAGNCLINRKILLKMDGFDENFIDVAYRFENDLSDRVQAKGYKIFYQPGIFIWHMKAYDGGTRSYGHHLTTLSKSHSVGDYYYMLKSPMVKNKASQIISRLIKAPMTSFHLKNPWYIPITIIAEFRGLIRAIILNRKNK